MEVAIVDDEEYEKDENFFIELGKPRQGTKDGKTPCNWGFWGEGLGRCKGVGGEEEDVFRPELQNELL